MIKEVYFAGRRPSKAQVIKAVIGSLNEGYDSVEVSWGENSLSIEKFHGKLIGHGWIKTLGGQDLANELYRSLLANYGLSATVR